MRVQYLEHVTPDVDAVCAAYEASLGLTFGAPVDALGGARTAERPDGSWVGVRGPMRDDEAAVVRPYWLVDDIEAALAAAAEAGATVAHPAFELPEWGWFAIVLQGGIESGFWQL